MSVRLPMFDGDHKKFQMWNTRFRAFATVSRFAEALAPQAMMPAREDELIDETTDDGRLKALAIRRNGVAMANLSMAFTSEGTMGLVYKAMNPEWPGGLAYLVMEALNKKYRPQDTITRVELRQKLNKVAMKKNQDPATLFEQVSSIENQCNAPGVKIDEGDLIAVILDAAPEEYHAVLTLEQRLRGDKLTLNDLETAMNQFWRQGKTPKTNDGNDAAEISLSAFGGVCYNCKKKGHKANKCPDKEHKDGKGTRPKGNGDKFNGKCNNCGKVGHKEANCWEKEENKHKRPEGFKSRSAETAASAVDNGSRVEFLLCGMTFPTDQAILMDPNVWIADTAATVHNTPHMDGMTNLRDAEKSDAITMGNGISEKAVKIANINGVMCDMHGVEIAKATMQKGMEIKW